MKHELTPDEHRVLELLAAAWNEFIKLPEEHPSDISEFIFGIHMAQNLILKRPALRSMEEEAAT